MHATPNHFWPLTDPPRGPRTKPFLLLIFLSLLLLVNGKALGSGPVEITISTTDSGIAYTMHDPGYRVRMPNPTLDQIEAQLKAHPDDDDTYNTLVTIYPDDRTSFKTVLDLLRRVKAASRKNFIVITRESSNGAEVRHHLRGSTEDVRSFPGEKPSK